MDFVGDTISKGKKNNHMFHNACTTHIINYYEKERVEARKDTILMNIVWTDNCLIQYKCCQNFWKVALSAMANKAIIVHKLAQNVRFKGPWDATGKLIKQVIQNNELCNAWDYYIKMKRDLTRNGQEEKTRNLLEYEQYQDILLLNNTPFTTRHIHIGFGTKKLEDLNTLKLHHCNIFYTNRSNIEDMNVVANTLKISQVSGELQPSI